MEASLESGAKPGKVGKKKAGRAQGQAQAAPARRTRRHDAAVGDGVLRRADRGRWRPGGIFLQHNFESIREVNALTDRSKQVDVINSDMLRARVNLMVAARRRNRVGAAARFGSRRGDSPKGATDLLTGVRARFADFQKNMLQDDTGRQLSMNLVRATARISTTASTPWWKRCAARITPLSTWSTMSTARLAARVHRGHRRVQQVHRRPAAGHDRTGRRQLQPRDDRGGRGRGAGVDTDGAGPRAVRAPGGASVGRGRPAFRQDRRRRPDQPRGSPFAQRNRATVRGAQAMQESLTRTVSTVRRGVDEITVGSREISAATRTCPAAPRSRRPRWKRPRLRWNSWPRPSSRTRTTRARPISWRPARRTWPNAQVPACRKW